MISLLTHMQHLGYVWIFIYSYDNSSTTESSFSKFLKKNSDPMKTSLSKKITTSMLFIIKWIKHLRSVFLI